MRNGRLFHSTFIALLAATSLGCLAACGAVGTKDLTTAQRQQVEASTHPIVRTFVASGYRALRLTRPQASQSGVVTLRKCDPAHTFQECAKGQATFDAPELRVNVTLDSHGQITNVVGLQMFKAAAIDDSITRVWTCKFKSNFADEDITPAFMTSVFQDFDGLNVKGDKEFRIPSPAPAIPVVQLYCGHN